MATTAAKIMKGSCMGAQLLLLCPPTLTSSCCRTGVTAVGVGGMSNHSIHYPLLIKKATTLTLSSSIPPSFRHRFPSFCTAANSNVDETNTNATTTSSATAEAAVGDGDGDGIKDAANMLDIRVGRIIKAWRHEEADSLYVEEVDVGEAEPRIICSGLVNYIPLHQLQDRNVVVLANLKPRNMRGVKSNGMLMAASDASHQNVELLEPREGSIPGERIWFGSPDDKQNQPSPATPNQIQKKRIWETVQPHLKTNDSCSAMLEGNLMQTSAGVVVCESLQNANIS